METGLVSLATAVNNDFDREVIDNVFRAAHSIKGGSATFGFEDIAKFTHLLETTLDTLRDSAGIKSATVFEVLLRSVDGLHELISARMEGRPADETVIGTVAAELACAWQPDLRIRFRPGQNLFRSGNDPLIYLLDLGTLGILTSQADLSGLPSLAELDLSKSYLAWDLTLRQASANIQQVKKTFEWIEDECELTIEGVAAEKCEAVPVEVTKKPDGKKGSINQKDSASLRVAASKIDGVINLIGELVITQSMLSCVGDEFEMKDLPKLQEGIAQLGRNTRELQETVLKMRMLPISTLFDRFPRMVHDLSQKLDKPVTLQITGEQTELDKTVLEKLGDPLVHLLRNCMDHGIEATEVRRAAGKPIEGTIHLHAEHKGGNVVIEILDDGGGLNEERILARAKERGLVHGDAVLTSSEIHALIFEPGFSTAIEVTDLSGRGVGMDVVRRNVVDLNGRIDLSSQPGQGTTVTIQLPLTLAIMDAQLMLVGQERFAVPLISIIESVRVVKSSISAISGGAELYHWRGEYLRVVRLSEVFGLKESSRALEEGLLVVVESHGKRVALAIDDLLAQQQVVIRSLEENFHRVYGVAGATILGDGTVAMIVDVGGVMERPRATASGSH